MKEHASKTVPIKKPRKCGNCGLVEHTRADCVQAEQIIIKNTTATSVKQIQRLFK